MDPFVHVYDDKMLFFKLPSLKSHRAIKDVIFAYKIVNNLTNCDECLNFFYRENCLMYCEIRTNKLYFKLDNTSTYSRMAWNSKSPAYAGIAIF